MNKNVGTIDKAVRILIAVIMVALYFTNVISGVLAIILLVVAGVLIATSLLSFCPIWQVLGIRTRKKE